MRRSLDAYALRRATSDQCTFVLFSNLLHQDSYSMGLYSDDQRRVFRQGYAPSYANVRLNVETKF